MQVATTLFLFSLVFKESIISTSTIASSGKISLSSNLILNTQGFWYVYLREKESSKVKVSFIGILLAVSKLDHFMVASTLESYFNWIKSDLAWFEPL